MDQGIPGRQRQLQQRKHASNRNEEGRREGEEEDGNGGELKRVG
jgi:hypothetical protein